MCICINLHSQPCPSPSAYKSGSKREAPSGQPDRAVHQKCRTTGLRWCSVGEGSSSLIQSAAVRFHDRPERGWGNRRADTHRAAAGESHRLTFSASLARSSPYPWWRHLGLQDICQPVYEGTDEKLQAAKMKDRVPVCGCVGACLHVELMCNLQLTPVTSKLCSPSMTLYTG